MRLKMRGSIILLVGMLGVLPVLAGPTNRYVSLTGSTTIPYDTWAKAGTNLKTVVDYANGFAEGDTVWIANGVYTLAASITVQNTIVKSFNTNVAGTIVNVYCFLLTHTNAWVEGITITNGINSRGGGVNISLGTLTNCVVRNCRSSSIGGGVMFENNSTGVVANCTIANNWAFYYGGGVIIGEPSRAAIRNCTIVSNTALNGGGVYTYANLSNVIMPLDNCDIAYNMATNMAAADSGGGGIYVSTLINLVAANCRIYGNTASTVGGGIHIKLDPNAQNYPIFRNCGISNNVALYSVASTHHRGGGGIFAGGGIFSGCTISGNISSDRGGGIYFYSRASVMTNCVIRANTAGDGGGAYAQYLYSAGAYVDLYNCLIAENTATNTGGGIYVNPYSGTPGPVRFYNCTIASNVAIGAGSVGGILKNSGGTSYYVNVIAYLNSGVTYSNWTGSTVCFSNSCTAPTNGAGFMGSGNTALNPLFADPGAGDFRPVFGSPCINAGVNQSWMDSAVDLDGHARIIEGTVDMGAYERVPRGTIFTIH